MVDTENLRGQLVEGKQNKVKLRKRETEEKLGMEIVKESNRKGN